MQITELKTWINKLKETITNKLDNKKKFLTESKFYLIKINGLDMDNGKPPILKF